jgi:hypothetical protein
VTIKFDIISEPQCTIEDFEHWLRYAPKRDTLCYFYGLTVQNTDIQKVVYQAAERGQVFLYRKRVGYGRYKFYARKVSKETGEIIKPTGNPYE